ncbi:MAG: HAD family hydrolase [Erysipelotrichaceae bacterium]|nr:HAD family hydrolase [Erysipelotrichaceae bacterium]
MNRKIIFLDCDGTLFDMPRGMEKVSDKSRYAIKELIKNGHLVYIASGRSKCLMTEDITSLNPTGFITGNGGCAFNSEKIIFTYDIPQDKVDAVVNYCNDHNGVYYLETQEYIRTRDITDPLHIAFITCWGVNDANFIDDVGLKDNYQMMMTAFNSEEECFEFEKAMNGIVDYRKQYGFTSFDVGEFGIDKGYGVKKVLEYYGIDKKDAYAFGDGLNDLEMLQAVEESYAVENANPKLKALAKNVAPDVLDDGFYQIMVQDGLIKPID